MEWQLERPELLKLLAAEQYSGSLQGCIRGIADLAEAHAAELSFLGSAKYVRHLKDSGAGVILVPRQQAGEPRAGQLWIYCEDPSLALARLCEHLEMQLAPPPLPGIHGSAIVAEGVAIGADVVIGPYCIVESGVMLGDGVVLESNVRVGTGARIGAGSVLRHGAWLGPRCVVGERCLLHSGCAIGGDGFGFSSSAAGHRKLPQIGRVVLGNDVEIGCNTTIDRARFAATTIGDGTKVDNLVQIGHNVEIGKHCIICAQVGIAGSTKLGDFVVFAGQVGVNGHIEIGSGTQAVAQSGISKSCEPGSVLSGMPARPRNEELRRHAALGKLPEALQRIKALEAQVAGLLSANK